MPKPRANLLKRAERWTLGRYCDRTLLDYEPFLTVRDVPSKGRCHRIPSWTVGRLHHLFSILEASWFYVADELPWVVDIREQYPLLPMEETVAIARYLNVRHPQYRKELVPMTTDMVLTHREGALIPVSVKYVDDMLKRRTAEKLEIERIFWARRGRRVIPVTERGVNEGLVAAIRWIHDYRDYHDVSKDPSYHEIIETLYQILHKSPYPPIAYACKSVDHRLGLVRGHALQLVRYCLSQRAWPVTLSRGINTLAPMPWID